MRISDWSSDVCSSDLIVDQIVEHLRRRRRVQRYAGLFAERPDVLDAAVDVLPGLGMAGDDVGARGREGVEEAVDRRDNQMDVEVQHRMRRSEEHTSELQ